MLVSIRKGLNVFCQLSCSLGKQVLGSFTIFFPYRSLLDWRKHVFFVFVGNNTEFLFFCAVKALTLPFHYILSVSFKSR